MSITCPRCARSFDTAFGLDVHRRRSPGCAYRPGEPTAGWRPGLLALPGRTVALRIP